ncbi:MAG: PrgI family protein [Candidatus Magasanikbacteria bacterium]|nr:PrgI family protein [Candidatus Magasanikbacteria bacterium]
MMQFVVPQFIDVEDKIFGPITVRQFIIILVDGLILAVIYKLVDLSLFVVLFLLFGGAGFVLAFVKINGQPFHYFLLNFLQTMRKPPLRVWQKKYSAAELKKLARVEQPPLPTPKPFKEAIATTHLSEMILVVDTGGRYTPEE